MVHQSTLSSIYEQRKTLEYSSESVLVFGWSQPCLVVQGRRVVQHTCSFLPSRGLLQCRRYFLSRFKHSALPTCAKTRLKPSKKGKAKALLYRFFAKLSTQYLQYFISHGISKTALQLYLKGQGVMGEQGQWSNVCE